MEQVNAKLSIALSTQSNTFFPALAQELGINQSIILITIDRLSVNGSSITREGHRWVGLNAKARGEHFSWLSDAKLKKYLDELINSGYLLTENFNVRKLDSTLWLSVNYATAAKLKSVGVVLEDNAASKSVETTGSLFDNRKSGEEKPDYRDYQLRILSNAVIECCALNKTLMNRKDVEEMKDLCLRLRKRHTYVLPKPSPTNEQLAEVIIGFSIYWQNKTGKDGEKFSAPTMRNVRQNWEFYIRYCEVELNGRIPVKTKIS